MSKSEITPAPDPAREHARREKAAEFLASHEDTSFTYEEEKAVLRRIDSRVLPLLLGAYFFQQLDKSTLRQVSIPNLPTRSHKSLFLLIFSPLPFLPGRGAYLLTLKF